MAIELVKRAQTLTMPFRAVVADAFYGSHLGFREDLATLDVPYVLAEQPSHAWWRPAGALGSVYDLAQAAPWQVEHPRHWPKLLRRFRDGHTECWWALEAEGGPYGRDKAERLVIASTDPRNLAGRADLVSRDESPRAGGRRSVRVCASSGGRSRPTLRTPDVG